MRGEDGRVALLGGGELMGLALGTEGDGGFHSFFRGGSNAVVVVSHYSINYKLILSYNQK